MSKTFHIGDLISVGVGYVMPPNDMDGVYALLNHLTGDNLMTHQLPAAAQRMAPYLLVQFPWLVGLKPPHPASVDVLIAWLAEVSAVHGEQHEVVPPSSAVWGEHDALADLREMAPGAKIIAIELPESEA